MFFDQRRCIIGFGATTRARGPDSFRRRSGLEHDVWSDAEGPCEGSGEPCHVCVELEVGASDRGEAVVPVWNFVR